MRLSRPDLRVRGDWVPAIVWTSLHQVEARILGPQYKCLMKSFKEHLFNASLENPTADPQRWLNPQRGTKATKNLNELVGLLIRHIEWWSPLFLWRWTSILISASSQVVQLRTQGTLYAGPVVSRMVYKASSIFMQTVFKCKKVTLPTKITMKINRGIAS